MDKLVKVVTIDQIEEGPRERKDYGADTFNDLVSSIKKHGLIQPIAVRENSEGDKPYTLIAGGRRFRALQALEHTEVTIRIFPSDLTDIEKLELEVAENFNRKDLDFREYTTAMAKLHKMKQAIEGPKVSTSPDAPGWGTRETAKALNVDQSTVVKDLQIAEMLETNPELFDHCKSKSDAAKVIANVKKDAIVRELSKRVQAGPKEGVKRELMDSYMSVDFFEGVKNIPDGCVDMVELDPPYGINLKEQKQSYKDNYNQYNEIDASTYKDFIKNVLKECYRVMSENSWIIMWYAQEPWQEMVYASLVAAGFRGHRMFGVWSKTQAQTNQPNHNLANSTECFYYMRKGKPLLAKPGRINNFIYSAVPPNDKTHPTERPIELMTDILSTFGHPTMRVMVPFAGSGVTLIAAHLCGMKPFGYELVKAYRDSYLVKVHKL